MAFDDLEAELALLINQMDTPPENPHDFYLRIMEKLNEFKALGLPLPGDLVRGREGAKPISPSKRRPPRSVSVQGVIPAKAGIQ